MKNYEVYEFTAVASAYELVYAFNSLGPKGSIRKIVQFQEAENKTYNLAFGNRNPDGTLDDLTVNDNKDRDKILATVGCIVSEFVKHHSDCYVFFSGSTKSRTRLYRMAISINYQDLSQTLEIWGINENFQPEQFQPINTYFGFLVKHK